MIVSSRQSAATLALAVLGSSLVGCSTGELRDSFREATTTLRVQCAAEKAYLHRGDLFHECCSCPLDFKHGFKNGYVDVAMHGEDCCAPPTPPSCYWGCCTTDPCERVERLNCYYDGWAHGAIAASQDGVAGLNTVPIRNICGGYNAPGPGGYGPQGYGPDASFMPPGPGEPAGLVPPAPPAYAPLTGEVVRPERVDEPLQGGPTPAPIPLPTDEAPNGEAEDGVEDSVRSSNTGGLLDQLLDQGDEAFPPSNVEPGSEPVAEPAEPTFPEFDSDDSTTRFETGFQGVPTASPAGSPSEDGPRVTTLWGPGS